MSSLSVEIMRALQDLHKVEDEISELKNKELKPELKAQHEALRAKILPAVLGHHDRMRLRGKKSVAIVRNGVCTGCHIMVAVGALNILRRGEDIQLCGNCGRYLVLEEQAPAAPAPEVEAKPARKKRAKKVALETAPAPAAEPPPAATV